jgi:hypothetical protein
MKPAREFVELVEGRRVYFSDDHWVTVWETRGLGSSHRKVLDKAEADRIRYIAVIQHGGGRDDAKKAR